MSHRETWKYIVETTIDVKDHEKRIPPPKKKICTKIRIIKI